MRGPLGIAAGDIIAAFRSNLKIAASMYAVLLASDFTSGRESSMVLFGEMIQPHILVTSFPVLAT